MIRSMTGFGRSEVAGDRSTLSVEARSVNHRHLDVSIRLPHALASLEAEVRRVVQARVERGRVDVNVQWAALAGESAQEVRVDIPLARHHLEAALAVARDLDLGDDVPVTWLLERPGVVQLADAAPPDPAAAAPLLARAAAEAMDQLRARRETEGAALAAELTRLHAELAAAVGTMAERAPVAVERREERLRERLRALLGEVPVDESRVLTEVAVWASKLDVTEELARLRAHLGEFAAMLGRGGAVGRALDFLIQELNREVNTVASKADDLELSQAALAARSVLEKLREQVQNLE